MTQTPADGALNPDHINELARNFWYSAILRAAIKLDVFNLLSSENLTAATVAQRLQASPRYVQSFLDCCVALDLLERDEDKYRNSPMTARFLEPGQPEYVGDHALHHTNTWLSWGHLDETIRSGEMVLPFETGFVDAETYWTNYMMGQHNRATSGQGEHLVRNVDLSDRRRLIDLGGGAASYSIALCQANPRLTAVVVDQKEPLQVAQSYVAEHHLQDRISLLEGDFLEAELGAGYDVALISGVVLISPEEVCRRAFTLAYDLLEPGGMLIVQDYMRIDHAAERGKLDAMEDLYVLVAFSSGAGDREGEEVASWMAEAGFQNTRLISLPTQLGLAIAEKPARG